MLEMSSSTCWILGKLMKIFQVNIYLFKSVIETLKKMWTILKIDLKLK